MKKKGNNYKNTWTYHGTVKLDNFNKIILNHGTESKKRTRSKEHEHDAENQGLVYNTFDEKQDRLFGTDVISPVYDKDFIKHFIDRLNKTYLKNEPEENKAKTLKEWYKSLGILSHIDRGYYDALRSAKLSETECCIFPDFISIEQIEEIIKYVEDNWYHTTPSLRISAKSYKDKTDKEKKMAAKPIPANLLGHILNQLRFKRSFNERCAMKIAVIQGIIIAWNLITQEDFKHLKEITVIITADDKEKHEDLYKILLNDSRFTLIECEEDSEVQEVYKNMKINTDVVLMNPPYNGNLHLKVLEEVLNNVKTDCIVLNISPIRWIQDIKATEKTGSDFNTFKETIYDKIKVVKEVPARTAQDSFGIIIGTDLGVYTFDNNNDLIFAGLIPNLMLEKVMPKLTTLPKDLVEDNKQDGWRVRIPQILSGGKSGGRGGKKWYGLGLLGPYYDGKKDNKPWYTFYNSNQFSKTTPYITKSVGFGENKEQAENFCNSLNTTLGLYITYNLIPDVNVRPSTIMWLDNYDMPWDNKRLCEYFDINGFISDTDALPGSEWEEILNFVKEHNIC